MTLFRNILLKKAKAKLALGAALAVDRAWVEMGWS